MNNAPSAEASGLAAPEPTLELKAEAHSSVGQTVEDVPVQPHDEQATDGETLPGNADAENTVQDPDEEGGDSENGNEGEVEQEEDEEEEGYGAEYRSLLFRVTDLETQEEQRGRQQRFALRMARREAQLMSRVVRQQQVLIATRASQRAAASDAAENSGRLVGTKADSAFDAGSTQQEQHHLTSSDAVKRAVAADARLICAAYRAEHARQRQRQLLEASAQLRHYTPVVQHDLEYAALLRRKTQETLTELCDAAGIKAHTLFPPAISGEKEEEGMSSSALVPQHLSGLAVPDAWAKHSTSLTTLGGTLAKVHTLFHDVTCRSHMAVVAAQLSQLGRHTQSLLSHVQVLTQQEAELEATLRQSRPVTVEWGVAAAHAQQAREMNDIYSSVTVAETRAVALRKVLLRRRQELQTALTMAMLREAEREVIQQQQQRFMNVGAPVATTAAPLFTSPLEEVTAEKMAAQTEDCTRREALRDRLWRELLFLKKCARRELGVAWVAQWEAAAVCETARAAETKAASQWSAGLHAGASTFAATLTDNVRASSYDNLARVVLLAAQTPPPQPSPSGAPINGDDNAGAHQQSATVATTHFAAEASAESSPPSSPQSPLSPTSAYPPRVRAVALLESVQTRVNSLTSLLLENAKHWQRVTDMQAEVACSCGPRDEAWRRTAELLLRRCTSSGSNGHMSAESVEVADEVVGDSRKAPAQSVLLEMEQQLLESFAAAEKQVLDEVNAGFAQLQSQCIQPLQRVKKEVALLVRLLQLADEAIAEAHTQGTTSEAHRTVPCLAGGTRTTPNLEKALQLFCAEAGVESGTSLAPSTDAFDALLHRSSGATSPLSSAALATSSLCELPRFSLPQVPLQTATLQSAMAAVSAEWHDALQSDTATLRAGVLQKQASLERYAQYSMADVPALLEKARVALKAQKEQLAGQTAQRSRAATLAAELSAVRDRLQRCTGSERGALAAAREVAVREKTAVEAEVVFLRACVALRNDEKVARRSACAEEAASWTALMAAVEDSFVDTLDSAVVKNGDTTGVAATVKSEEEETTAVATPHSTRLDASYDERMKVEEAGDNAGLRGDEAGEEEEEEEGEEGEAAERDMDEENNEDADFYADGADDLEGDEMGEQNAYGEADTEDAAAEEEEEEGREEENNDDQNNLTAFMQGEGQADGRALASDAFYDAAEPEDAGDNLPEPQAEEDLTPPTAHRHVNAAADDGDDCDDEVGGVDVLSEGNHLDEDASLAEESTSPVAHSGAPHSQTSSAADKSHAAGRMTVSDAEENNNRAGDNDEEDEQINRHVRQAVTEAEEEEGKTATETPGQHFASAVAVGHDEEQEQAEEDAGQQPSTSLAGSVLVSGTTEDFKPDEEAVLLSEEAEGAERGSVLGDSAGILDGGAAAALPLPPPPPPPPPPVLPSNAVLDDNPFYSGFGFDD